MKNQDGASVSVVAMPKHLWLQAQSRMILGTSPPYSRHTWNTLAELVASYAAATTQPAAPLADGSKRRLGRLRYLTRERTVAQDEKVLVSFAYVAVGEDIHKAPPQASHADEASGQVEERCIHACHRLEMLAFSLTQHMHEVVE